MAADVSNGINLFVDFNAWSQRKRNIQQETKTTKWRRKLSQRHNRRWCALKCRKKPSTWSILHTFKNIISYRNFNSSLFCHFISLCVMWFYSFASSNSCSLVAVPSLFDMYNVDRTNDDDDDVLSHLLLQA